MQNLEQLLDAYLGCVLVVSHDKAFMTNVVSSMFVLEGDGLVRKFNGKYGEYLEYIEQRRQIQQQQDAEAVVEATTMDVRGSSNGTIAHSNGSGSTKVHALSSTSAVSRGAVLHKGNAAT